MDISVVIATFNQAERLRLVLRGLQEQILSPNRFEVLVIDDGCTDNTVAIAESRQMDNLRVISLRENMGRNAARNRGIEEARGELVVFLDGDALPAPDLEIPRAPTPCLRYAPPPRYGHTVPHCAPASENAPRLGDSPSGHPPLRARQCPPSGTG